MSDYSNKRIRYVTVADFNKLLKYVNVNGFRVIEGERDRYTSRVIANIVFKKTSVELTFRDKGETVTYICSLDGKDPDELKTTMTGHESMRILGYYYKIPRLNYLEYGKSANIYGYKMVWGKPTWAIQPAKAILWANPEFDGQRISNCYCYDVNSAYSAAMLKPMPDTSRKVGYLKKPNAYQIGFRADGSVVIGPSSETCLYVFPLIESPFKRFVEHWYKAKLKAKTGFEKNKAKQILNYPIGYCARINPFIRNTIIYYANSFIEKFKDENTLFINTDSIVSRVRRPDIEQLLGNDIGQFKIEHTGEFAYTGMNYQWNHDLPHYRGISKGWFKILEQETGHPFDILIDTVPNILYNEYIPTKIGPNYYQLKRNQKGDNYEG